MTDKAYIVANEQQEREVLEKLEQEGLVWIGGREATEWMPSQSGLVIFQFPYALVDVGYVAWRSIWQLKNYEIVYDGRKEEQMSEKYVVSQEFMYGLKEWRKNKNLINDLVWYTDIKSIPEVVKEWWAEDFVDETKTNNRLIAIIRWVNGEDVFEVEKHKKWVVRSKDSSEAGRNLYVMLDISHGVNKTISFWDKDIATKFDTKEEAESWANSHQEVIEVEI